MWLEMCNGMGWDGAMRCVPVEAGLLVRRRSVARGEVPCVAGAVLFGVLGCELGG